MLQRFRGKQTEREAELTAMIEDLVWGMHLWACDEDGIHPDAYRAFQEAIRVAVIPANLLVTDDDETAYQFHPNFAARMRLTREMRAAAQQPTDAREG